MGKLLLIVIMFGLLSFLSAEESKRLLLNDPDVLSARISKLETAIQQFTIENQKQETTIQQLTLDNQRQDTTVQQLLQEIQKQKLTIQQLKVGNQLINTDTGITYVRWGRKQCPYNSTELVYSGYAGGGWYDQPGSSAEPVCLPPDPDFDRTSGTSYEGRMYGAEFDDNFFHPSGAAEDVPCAVCRVKSATSVITIPGKNKCYSGWNMEFHGYLAANDYRYKAAGTYVCMDINPEFLTGGAVDHDGKLFYSVIAKCGSLQCPPYKNNYPLTCVVCSK